MMKVFIHIHNDDEFCDSRVRTMIAIDGRPVIGDTLFLSQVQLDLLAEQAEGIYKAGREHIYGEPDKYGSLSFEDYFFVWDTMWKPDRDGIYHLHVELSDKERHLGNI